MFKNLSIRKIAVISSISIIALMVITFMGTRLLLDNAGIWYQYLLLFVIGGFFAFFIIRYFLDIFIYRKIKLIYKIIRKSKVSLQDDELANIEGDLFGSVEDEVVKWAEDQQKEIESLRALETYRRDYVGNISHELKTPIFNIQGYIHTILDDEIEDAQIFKYYLKRAAKNVERLQNIVQDLDMIAKIESDAAILDITSFDIRKLVEEVFDHLEMQAKKNDVHLQFKEGADRNFMVNADRENMRQVFINLILNAIKYGKEDGYVKVSFYDMEKEILVEIADDGIGIEEGHLKHLFDRFYRVEKSRSREAGGTGLGLAIVKHILEAHKQTITVRSTEGVGSTFGFTLAKS